MPLFHSSGTNEEHAKKAVQTALSFMLREQVTQVVTKTVVETARQGLQLKDELAKEVQRLNAASIKEDHGCIYNFVSIFYEPELALFMDLEIVEVPDA